MRRKYFLLILFYLFSSAAFHAQNRKADSLIALLKLDKEDTNRAKHLEKLGRSLDQKIDTALLLYNQSLLLSQKLNWQKGIGLAYSDLAGIEYTKSNNSACIENHTKALEIWEKIYPPDGGRNASVTLGNIGLAYATESNYPEALNYYFKALKLAEKYGDKLGVSRHEGNIGIAYQEQNDMAKAQEFYIKALKEAQEIKDERLIDFWLGNIGQFYNQQGKYDLSLDYLTQALTLAQKLDDEYLISTWRCGIGNIYLSKKEFVKANENFLLALAPAEKMEDRKLYVTVLGNLGILYVNAPELGIVKGEEKTGYALAEIYLIHAIALSDSIGLLYEKKDFEAAISELYSKMGDDKKALLHYQNATMIKDSLFNLTKSKEITRLEMTREFEKKDAIAKAEQEKKDLEAAEQNKQQKIIIYSAAGILLLIIIFSISLFRRFKITQQQNRVIELQKAKVTEANEELRYQNEEIEDQKRLIEEHQKEMVDSINYAKRIQDAILPPIELIREKLPDSFVLYKPKAIVAGDFYWMEEINDTIFIAAADCTGHGVPGAMVSVVCSNALNRAVKEFHLSETGKILDKVTDLVLETFEKSATDVKDGMDISILSVNKEMKRINWSGANNPLWYFQNKELVKITANKQPVGKSDHRKPFTTHAIEFKPGTTFYLFSDGYSDQFGGPKGKKFMYRNFHQTLALALDSSPENQMENLNSTFENWKGELEQVDDVIVIGIRI